jgi:hypothetical protein
MRDALRYLSILLVSAKFKAHGAKREFLAASHCCASHEPLKCPLHESLCVSLDAHTVSDDQPIEIPREQLFEGAPREVPMNEGQPDVERYATIRISDAS